MTKELFLTFGDGRHGFKFAASRLSREVANSSWKSDQLVINAKSASNFMGKDWHQHLRWMTGNKRGFGLWLWKPLIIKNALMGTFGNYDRVFYLDAGSQFSLKSTRASDRFIHYLDVAKANSGIAFTHVEGQAGISDYSEEAWGKSELHRALSVDQDLLQTNQILAGCLILTRDALDVVDNWLTWCTKENYFFLKDPSSLERQSPRFVNHRHDQSILSVLWKKSELPTVPNETWFAPDWEDSGRDFPIWTIRNDSSFELPTKSLVTNFSHKSQITYSRVIDKLNGL